MQLYNMPRTVFILGAGASKPYGFPLGEELVQEIIDRLHFTSFHRGMPTKNNNELGIILLDRFDLDYINSFRNALIKSGTFSIDSFLTNRDDFRTIGKMCIAYILMAYEKKSLSGDSLFQTGNWYKLFWNRINTFKESKEFDFSIYTFNYDRSLEYYIYSTFKNLNNATDNYLNQYFNNFPITHLHGDLGTLKFMNQNQSIPYGNLDFLKNAKALEEVSQWIDVIYEVNENEKFIKLHKELGKAQQIIFMGFGFHPDNMRRIQLNKFLANTKLFATAFKMTEMELISAFSPILGDYTKKYPDNKWRFGKALLRTTTHEDCYTFLRNNFDFDKLIK